MVVRDALIAFPVYAGECICYFVQKFFDIRYSYYFRTYPFKLERIHSTALLYIVLLDATQKFRYGFEILFYLV